MLLHELFELLVIAGQLHPAQVVEGIIHPTKKRYNNQQSVKEADANDSTDSSIR